MTCWQGPQYATEMDVLLGAAEALRAGRRVTNFFVCAQCGRWHLGFPKKLDPRCTVTGKRIFATEAEADDNLKLAIEKAAQGLAWRREQRVYECPRGGCGGWHLTSQ